jgi:hypothetical protein
MAHEEMARMQFLAFLIALALAGGWAKERQNSNIADANIETNQG